MKKFFKKYKALIIYFLVSCLAFVLDIAIVFLITGLAPLGQDGLIASTVLVTANIAGNFAGFLLSYVLSSKQVFDTRLGVPGLVIYLVTFLFGLVLAATILWLFMKLIGLETLGNLGLLISKGFSVTLPFFILYYISFVKLS